jgi:hypothetical protein
MRLPATRPGCAVGEGGDGDGRKQREHGIPASSPTFEFACLAEQRFECALHPSLRRGLEFDRH